MILNTTSKAVESRQDKTTSVSDIFVYDTVMQGVIKIDDRKANRYIDITRYYSILINQLVKIIDKYR